MRCAQATAGILATFWFVPAISVAEEEAKHPHGLYDSSLTPPIPPPASAPKGELSLIAAPTASVPNFEDELYPLYLSNRTRSAVTLPSSDFSLDVIEQARDEDGRWKALERYPSPTCGNSSIKVKLGPDMAWLMFGRKHSGSFRTRFRFKLNSSPPLYSNEFEGSVDPNWFKLGRDWMAETHAARLVADGEFQWRTLCQRLQWPRVINFQQFLGTKVTIAGHVSTHQGRLFVTTEYDGQRVVCRIRASEAESRRLITQTPNQPRPAVYGTLRKFDPKTRVGELDAVSADEVADQLYSHAELQE
jgi:hypothetical protein